MDRKAFMLYVIVSVVSNSCFGADDDIFQAIRDGDLTHLHELLGAGANVNQPDKKGWTALHVAVNWSNPKAVQVLMEHGADINAKDEDSWTPLHVAAASGDRIMAKVLIAYGADINAQTKWDETPLHKAAQAGHLRFAQLLVLCGAQVNLHNKCDKIPLQLARESGYKECAKEIEHTIHSVADMTSEQKNKAIQEAFSDVLSLFEQKKDS